ncbi:MAG: T9SS type A sorting domain-containing protein, partial [Bacteroidia bacterium]|nr:T9SS type A sorting domain-containing protein [Bacteroidia bacterium]
INIPANTTYGLYVTSNGGTGFSYTNGTAVGNLFAQNSDLQFFEGKGGSYFGVTISTRIWNGNIYYTKQGCTSPMLPVTLTVNPQPTVNINASPSNVICVGNMITLTASGADTYTWNTSATSTVISATPLTSTTYTVEGGSSLCPGSYTASIFVTVNPNPTINITSTPNASICAGNSVTLNANGAVIYNWSTSATTQSIVQSPSVTTTYSVVGTAANSCTSSAQVTITVNAKPTVSLSAASNTACLMGGPVTLTGSPAGGVYSGPNVSGNILNPTATGTFSPVYSYTNASTGCSNSATTNIVVSVCTDIVSQSAKSAFLKVYPNPNFGTFTIETGNELVKTIELTDITGRIILTQTTDSNTIQMNIYELANGVYHVRINSQNGIDIIKVVKQ